MVRKFMEVQMTKIERCNMRRPKLELERIGKSSEKKSRTLKLKQIGWFNSWTRKRKKLNKTCKDLRLTKLSNIKTLIKLETILLKTIAMSLV